MPQSNLNGRQKHRVEPRIGYDAVCEICNKTYFQPFTTYENRVHHLCSDECRQRCFALSKYKRSRLEILIEEHIKSKYAKLKVSFNNQNWVGIELDILFPRLEIAIELNGPHHYLPIHGDSKLLIRQQRDFAKLIRCMEKETKLVVVDVCGMREHSFNTVNKYLNFIDFIINNPNEVQTCSTSHQSIMSTDNVFR